MRIILQDDVVRTRNFVSHRFVGRRQRTGPNKEVYEKLAAQMREAGYSRTGVQCREKIKKLKTECKKIENNNESGRARRSTKIFEAMDRILGHRPATCPPAVVDSVHCQFHKTMISIIKQETSRLL